MVRNYTKKLGSDVVKKRLPLRDPTQLWDSTTKW